MKQAVLGLIASKRGNSSAVLLSSLKNITFPAQWFWNNCSFLCLNCPSSGQIYKSEELHARKSHRGCSHSVVPQRSDLIVTCCVIRLFAFSDQIHRHSSKRQRIEPCSLFPMFKCSLVAALRKHHKRKCHFSDVPRRRLFSFGASGTLAKRERKSTLDNTYCTEAILCATTNEKETIMCGAKRTQFYQKLTQSDIQSYFADSDSSALSTRITRSFNSNWCRSPEVKLLDWPIVIGVYFLSGSPKWASVWNCLFIFIAGNTRPW